MSSGRPIDFERLGIRAPIGYTWLVERNLASFEAFGPLQPWFLLSDELAFDATERWPSVAPEHRMIVFARRQDNDDLACFMTRQRQVVGVALAHGWTATGFQVLKTHPSIWEWLKDVIDDIAEWAEVTGSNACPARRNAHPPEP